MARRRNSFLKALEYFREMHLGLVVTDLIVFMYIAENEGLNISELAQLARLTGATASRRARLLATADIYNPLPPSLGLIAFTEGEEDARTRQLTLTARGREVREAIDRLIAEGDPIASPMSLEEAVSARG
jgi:DNA-binding MarR family transcriptional regulator